MLDLPPIPWALAAAVVAVILWVVFREGRAFEKGRGRTVKDVLDIALPVLAIAVLAHGLLLSNPRGEQLVNDEVAQEGRQGPWAEEKLTVTSAANPSNTQSMSDAALMAAALAAFQEGTIISPGPGPAVTTEPASLPAQVAQVAPVAPVAVVTETSQLDRNRPTHYAADSDVLVVLPVDGRNAPIGRNDAGVILSSDGTGVIVAQQGPVVVASTYNNPAYRVLRSCPDESCEIVANVSKFAPLTRTGKRHPAGMTIGLARPWVEVRSSGPHCTRYDPASMVGACLEWQRASVTGWTIDPTLLPAR